MEEVKSIVDSCPTLQPKDPDPRARDIGKDDAPLHYCLVNQTTPSAALDAGDPLDLVLQGEWSGSRDYLQ